ncbi:MAG: hypothetical protein PWQ51_841 [Methanolobus sp.]|jgi:hypothetical protein|nr:hypothetical protein [Methanolobus sp.]
MTYENKIKYLRKKNKHFFIEPSVLEKYEMEFAKALASDLDFKPDERDELLFRSMQVWPERQSIFGTNTPYENIFLGIALYVADAFYIDDKNNSPHDISYVVECLYGNQSKKHMTSIYRVYQTAQDIFD